MVLDFESHHNLIIMKGLQENESPQNSCGAVLSGALKYRLAGPLLAAVTGFRGHPYGQKTDDRSLTSYWSLVTGH